MMTWNEHVELQRAAAEFMGLTPPPATLAFGFLEAPPPKTIRCRRPPAPAAPYTPPAAGSVYHSRSIGRRPMPAVERMEMQKAERQLRSLGVYIGPPDTYAECPPPGTPCGHVSCRHHLGIDVDVATGEVTITHPVPDTDPSRRHLLDRLSRRDQEIKVLIDSGYSNAEIAATLSMRERSVRRIRYRIREKLNADPELDILAMTDTCSLRVAARGEHSQSQVALLMGGLERSHLAHLEAVALRKMREGDYGDEG